MRKLKNIELNRLDVKAFKNASKTPLIIVLDNVRSLYNIGAIFRTADAFLVEKIYLCGITATPPHMEIYKTALGATESVEWVYEKEAVKTVQKLKSQGIFTVAIEQTEGAVSLEKFSLDSSKKYAVVFGNEVKGVQQTVINSCDTCVEIPQFGTKHSLNISVSAGVVVWNFWKGFNYQK